MWTPTGEKVALVKKQLKTQKKEKKKQIASPAKPNKGKLKGIRIRKNKIVKVLPLNVPHCCEQTCMS